MGERRVELSRRRRAAGYTQESLAEALGVDWSSVRRWEAGTQEPRPNKRPKLARLLGCDLRQLGQLLDTARTVAAVTDELFSPASDVTGFSLNLCGDEWLSEDNQELAALLRDGAAPPITAGGVTRLVHQWLVVEPPQVVEVVRGRRVGVGLVGRVERRVARLRRVDDVVSGGDLHPLVERELRVTVELLRDASYDERVGRRLLVAVGELCQLAGWVLGDAGDAARAAHFYAVGVKAAHAAGAGGLAGNLVSSLAYQVSNVGDPRVAVLLARSADRGSRHATPAVRALCKERLAWAHARAGERRAAERTLAAVASLYDGTPADDEPDWVYWLDADEMAVMAGRCHVELDQADRAVPLLTEVLERYDRRRTRELALYTSWLAQAHLRTGAIDEAARTAVRALELTARTTSARGDGRIEVLRRELRSHRALPAVADFEAMARDLRT